MVLGTYPLLQYQNQILPPHCYDMVEANKPNRRLRCLGHCRNSQCHQRVHHHHGYQILFRISTTTTSPSPPSPSYEPVTPPRPPSPPYDDDNSSSRPPRLHRPKPVDPRLHCQPASPPPTSQREEAGRHMGLDSYVVESIVRHMSDDDWMEFLTRRKYGRALINELQAYLNEKYCNEEHTTKQHHYGQFCNRAMYPKYYPPYEMDISAKQYHMREDGDLPSSSAWSTMPHKRTFFRQEFGDGSFPVCVSEEEYDRLMFTQREFCMEDHAEPSGYVVTHTLPHNPARRVLRTIDSSGNEVLLRNTPRNNEEQ